MLPNEDGSSSGMGGKRGDMAATMAKRWSVDVAIRARDRGYKIPPDGRAVVISSHGGRTNEYAMLSPEKSVAIP